MAAFAEQPGGPAKAMRYVAMQVLTWGTIAGAIGSAVLLAALEGHTPRYGSELPISAPLLLPIEPTQAGRARPRQLSPQAPSASASASKPAAR